MARKQLGIAPSGANDAATKGYVDAEAGKQLSRNPTTLSSPTDLNDYVAIGLYHQGANANAASGSNYPVEAAGLLEVYTNQLDNSSFVYQRYTAYNSGKAFWRGRYSGVWQPWREVSQVGHNHPISEVTGLQTALDGKAASSHTHAIANVTGLQTALNGKAASSHTHAAATQTASGMIELATNAEALSGTDAVRAISPASLKYVVDTRIATSGDFSTMQGAISDIETEMVTREELVIALQIQPNNGSRDIAQGTFSTPLFVAPFPLRVTYLSLVHWGAPSIAANNTNWWLTRIRRTPLGSITPVNLATKTTRVSGGTEPAGEAWNQVNPWVYSASDLVAAQDCVAGDVLSMVFQSNGSPGTIVGPIIATVKYMPL